MKNENLTSTAKLCFGRLSQHVDDDGFCNVSFKQLSEDLGVSEATAERTIKDLIAAELIIKESPIGVQKLMHSCNRYKIIWNKYFFDSIKIESSM
jgi:CTP-dependent riboflavin kinase